MPRYINLNFSVLNPGVKEQAEKLSVCGWGGGGEGRRGMLLLSCNLLLC